MVVGEGKKETPLGLLSNKARSKLKSPILNA